MNQFKTNIGFINDFITHVRSFKGEDVERFPLNYEMNSAGPNFQEQFEQLLRGHYTSWAQEFLLKNDLYVEIAPNRLPGSVAPSEDNMYKVTNIYLGRRVGNTVPVINLISWSDRYNNGESFDTQGTTTDTTADTGNIDSYITVSINIEGGVDTYHYRGNHLTFYTASSKGMYTSKDIERTIKTLAKEIEEDEKNLDKKKQTLESYGWILSFMKDNKIESEEKTSLQTKLIVSIFKEGLEDENEMVTNISEVLNLNI